MKDAVRRWESSIATAQLILPSEAGERLSQAFKDYHDDEHGDHYATLEKDYLVIDKALKWMIGEGRRELGLSSK